MYTMNVMYVLFDMYAMNVMLVMYVMYTINVMSCTSNGIDFSNRPVYPFRLYFPKHKKQLKRSPVNMSGYLFLAVMCVENACALIIINNCRFLLY